MRKYAFIIVMVAVLLAMNAASGTGLETFSADLPPDGPYVSPTEFHEYAAVGIILDDPVHDRFTNIQRVAIGNDEQETFDSYFSAVEIGQGFGAITLTGPVEVLTTDRLLSTTGTFDTEIVSMSLSGGGMMVRQDPDRPSYGETEITDLGGGLYHIDSFFDVFTEMSPDGGANWYDCDYSTHMYLVPEPATLCLLGLGGLVLRKRLR